MTKKLRIVQYMLPFYKEKFVDSKQVQNWFRYYNYLHFSEIKQKNSENFVLTRYAPDNLASGVTLVGNGHAANFVKYLRWLTVRHHLIIELGRETDNYWSFGRQIEQKPYDHVTEEHLKSVLLSLSNRQVVVYDKFLYDNFEEAPKEAFVNSLELLKFDPPYVSLNLVCEGGLRIVNLVHKLSKLIDCPIALLEADRYQVEDLKKEDCLTKTDIYWPYMIESRTKYHDHILKLLKQHMDKEELKKPTHSRYLLYI